MQRNLRKINWEEFIVVYKCHTRNRKDIVYNEKVRECARDWVIMSQKL